MVGKRCVSNLANVCVTSVSPLPPLDSIRVIKEFKDVISMNLPNMPLE